MKGYYFITCDELSKNGTEKDIIIADNLGVEVIQYRNKNNISLRDFYEKALFYKFLCKKSLFIINDRVDIAMSVNSDGVHLGQKDIPLKSIRNKYKKIIGLSVSSFYEAMEAYNSGADYLGVGPIFSTNTKLDAVLPTGINLIKKIKQSNINLPIIAIGGINKFNVKFVIDAGADMVCAISDVITKDDINKEIKEYQKLFFRG